MKRIGGGVKAFMDQPNLKRVRIQHKQVGHAFLTPNKKPAFADQSLVPAKHPTPVGVKEEPTSDNDEFDLRDEIPNRKRKVGANTALGNANSSSDTRDHPHNDGQPAQTGSLFDAFVPRPPDDNAEVFVPKA